MSENFTVPGELSHYNYVYLLNDKNSICFLAKYSKKPAWINFSPFLAFFATFLRFCSLCISMLSL